MEAVNIQKSYGKKKVLTEVSFLAREGECTGFIGANGCGKSTLFKVLSGVEKADGGRILSDGRTFSPPFKELAGCIGYIPQESVLIEELTVRDNLLLFEALTGKNRDKERMEELCRQFSIREFERERVGKLSGGMKKRVNIVCALLGSPRILIMDEPSAALDLVFKQELKGYIEDFKKAGGSVLLSSHDQGEIGLCDRIYAIRDGMTKEINKSLPMEKIVAEYIR